MNKYEIIGRLLVAHNRCENQFSELGKQVDNIINQIVISDTEISSENVVSILSKFRLLEDIIKDYKSEINNIVLDGDIELIRNENGLEYYPSP